MPQLIADCPRCGTKQTGFDLLSHYKILNNPALRKAFDCFCVCRGCKRSVVFILETADLRTDPLPSSYENVNERFKVHSFQALRRENFPPPGNLPGDIKKVFVEATTCLSVNCYNAAGTMFRNCLDLATKSRVPDPLPEGMKKGQVKFLGKRLEWLFDNHLLLPGLRPLAECITEDGNDGAHDGTLTTAEAEDLLDFTFQLLEELYTTPARLALAAERRAARHAGPNPE